MITGRRRGSVTRWGTLAAAVVVAAVGGLVLSAQSPHAGAPGSPTCRLHQCTAHAARPVSVAVPFRVTSTSPAQAATTVATNANLLVDFTQPIARDSVDPTISPSVPGTWSRLGNDGLEFRPAAPFVPWSSYTLTVPSGITDTHGVSLTTSTAVSFTIAPGSVTRLQQLLAELGYLPVSYADPPGVPPADEAMAQSGEFSWRWGGLPSQYTAQWTPGEPGPLTTAAVRAFETQNGLTVDGIAGPQVWGALLADVAAHKGDRAPVTYVLVTKTLPEHLTVWVNGVLTFANVPCNTGVAGATTTDGTFSVFSHEQVSNMRGTDVTGTVYDVTVPWASYFNGGDALHGYPRTAYGFPQSNGCVEMPILTAGKVWPDTPIGTLVTIQGPPA